MVEAILRNPNNGRRHLWNHDASPPDNSPSGVLALEGGNSDAASVWLAFPRDLSRDRLGILPEEPKKNHRTVTIGRNLSQPSTTRCRDRMEHHHVRKSQLARHRRLGRTLLVCSHRLDTTLSHTMATIQGPIVATAIAKIPDTGKVTSQGRNIPRRADRIDSLRPLTPAVAPACM